MQAGETKGGLGKPESHIDDREPTFKHKIRKESDTKGVWKQKRICQRLRYCIKILETTVPHTECQATA